MPETFPPLLRPVGGPPKFMLENPSRSGGIALNGMEQTMASGAERWRCSGVWRAFGKSAILQFEAFLANMNGRAGEVLVPTFSGRIANWPIDTYGRVLDPGFTRNKLLDGTAYEDPAVPPISEIVATLGASVAIRVTQLSINMTQGSAIRAGQLFGLANRVYRIRSIVSVVGTVTTVTFGPPLRAAATLGAAITFTRPVCLMKFATDDQGSEFDTGFGGQVSLEFVETFS